ncbi:MAG: M56 family metallopeptidase, partial [Hyphomicrobiales bacterium]
MNIAAMILPQAMVEALGWTLFHSLWQGALAALAFAVILYFSRRASARARYGLGLAVLALMLLVSVLTFWNHYQAAGPGAVAPRAATTSAVPAPAAVMTARAANSEPSPSQRVVSFFSDYFSRHLPLIVTLWLLGVLFLALRFSGGMLYLQRLKYRQNRPLPPPWPQRLQELAARAGLQKPLQMLESLRLQTPVVIGLLKPVLLLPAGLVSGLPADEVEALLAHELAHVLRRDYLVNVLQNLVEILYFFHPGVRWISAGVRQEREHCCDDFAVALCGDARSYARALASLQGAGPACRQPA